MGRLKKSICEPKKWLDQKVATIHADNSISDDRLRKSERFGRALEGSIDEWFDSTYVKIVSQKEIEFLFDEFQKKFINEITEKITNPKESVFTSGMTPNLSAANTFTRSLSTKFGNIFEDIACLSPKVISSEKNFEKTKITGVDILIVEASKREIIFSQVKTAKGTLTGSQAPRSESELSVFRKGIFCAALNMGGWTFNSQQIERKSGSEFWELVGINEYEFIKQKAEKMFGELEELFKSFIN